MTIARTQGVSYQLAPSLTTLERLIVGAFATGPPVAAQLQEMQEPMINDFPLSLSPAQGPGCQRRRIGTRSRITPLMRALQGGATAKKVGPMGDKLTSFFEARRR